MDDAALKELSRAEIDKVIKRGIAYEHLKQSPDFKMLLEDITDAINLLNERWPDIPSSNTEMIIEYQTKAKLKRALESFISNGIDSAKIALEEHKIRELEKSMSEASL